MDVVFDLKKIDLRWRCHSNGVKYVLYRDDKQPSDYVPSEEELPKLHTDVCFSDIRHLAKNLKECSTWPNRLYYRMEQKLEMPELSMEEKNRWIELSKEHKFLPDYVLKNGMTEEKAAVMVMDLEEENLNPPLLYIYLSTLRFIREKPGYVKTMLHLVDDLGMDYFCAAVFASKLVVEGTGHHYLEVQAPYGTKASTVKVDEIEVNSGHISGLYRVVNNPAMYDKRIGPSKLFGSGWNCNTATGLKGAGKGFTVLLNKRHLMNPKIVEILRTISIPADIANELLSEQKEIADKVVGEK